MRYLCVELGNLVNDLLSIGFKFVVRRLGFCYFSKWIAWAVGVFRVVPNGNHFNNYNYNGFSSNKKKLNSSVPEVVVPVGG